MSTVSAPTSTSPRALPGPRGLDVLRVAWGLRYSGLATLRDAVRRWGDSIAFPLLPYRLVLLNHPEHVSHVLVEGAARYARSPNYEELEPVLGKGLLTSDGAAWKRDRRIVQPMFHKKPLLAQLGPIVRRATDDMLAEWRVRGAATFDLAPDAHRLALRVAGQALFSRDLGGHADHLARALRVALPFVQHRTEAVLRPPLWLPLLSHLRFRLARRSLDALVHGLIEDRRRARAPQESPDLLTRLLAARHPDTGEGLNDRQLRDEVITFLLAGHETSGNALAWLFLEVGRRPELGDALAAEVARVTGGRPPQPDDLPQLDLVGRVVHEALRLHPPAWMIDRLAREDDVVGGHRVEAGAIVLLCPWTTHRHEQFWPDPERFDPDRWRIPGARPRGAYFPFGGGQRQCVGEDFALIELKLVLARVVQAARLTADPHHRVVPHPGVTLRPGNGVRVRATWR